MKLEISTLNKAVVLAEALDQAMQNVQVSKATVAAMKDLRAKGDTLRGISDEQLKEMDKEGEMVENELEELISDLQPILDSLTEEDQEDKPLPPPNWNGK